MPPLCGRVAGSNVLKFPNALSKFKFIIYLNNHKCKNKFIIFGFVFIAVKKQMVTYNGPLQANVIKSHFCGAWIELYSLHPRRIGF